MVSAININVDPQRSQLAGIASKSGLIDVFSLALSAFEVPGERIP